MKRSSMQAIVGLKQKGKSTTTQVHLIQAGNGGDPVEVGIGSLLGSFSFLLYSLRHIMDILSTPLTTSYYDNPSANLKFLASLSVEEGKFYTLGYLQACDHFLETLIDTKNRILASTFDMEKAAAETMMKHVQLLDTLDTAVAERIVLIKTTSNFD
jgi:hypothetical protein